MDNRDEAGQQGGQAALHITRSACSELERNKTGVFRDLPGGRKRNKTRRGW